MQLEAHANAVGRVLAKFKCRTSGLARQAICLKSQDRLIPGVDRRSGICCCNTGGRGNRHNGTAKLEDQGLDSRSVLNSSTPAFFSKLLAASLAGSLLVKYGSLLIDLPFSPSATVALAFIFVPTLIFSGILVAKSASEG